MGGITSFLQRILQSKDFAESILLLCVAFISIKSITFSFENISSLVSIMFASIILLTTIVKIVQYAIRLLSNIKYIKKIRIYGSMSYASMDKKISKVMKMKYHPVAYASFKMHIENLIKSGLQE